MKRKNNDTRKLIFYIILFGVGFLFYLLGLYVKNFNMGMVAIIFQVAVLALLGVTEYNRRQRYDENTEYFLQNKTTPVKREVNSDPPVNMQVIKLIEWFAFNNKDVCWPDGTYKRFDELSEDVQRVVEGMFYISPFSYNSAVKAINLPERTDNDKST